MRRPLLPLGIGFAIGIYLAYYLNINSFFLCIILTLILALSLLRKKGDFFYTLIILFVIVGSLNVNSKYDRILYNYIDEEVAFMGVIDSIENSESGSKYILKLKSIGNKNINDKVLLTIYDDYKLDLGQYIKLKGQVKVPPENTNPYLFNYRAYLLGRGIEYQLITNPRSIEILDKEISLDYTIKKEFYKRVNRQFASLKPQNKEIITSLLLGSSNKDDLGDYDKYKDLGIAHILAISGLHIGIIASFLIYILSLIGVKRRYNYFVSLMILWTYGFLLAYPPSTLRALIMFTCIILSKVLNKPYDFLNVLAFSFIISLSINPFWLMNIGFLLSYTATISLGLILPPLREYFYPISFKIKDLLLSILSVNIGIFPLQSLYFNEFPIYSFISNILVVPIATFNLILGFLNLVFDIFTPLLDVILSLQGFIIDYMYKLPLRTLSVSSFKLGEIVLYYLIISLIFNLDKVELLSKEIKKTFFMSTLYILIVLSINVSLDKTIVIDFIDVGQGDAILIKKGSNQYIIDTGGSVFGTFDVGERVLTPYLIKTGNRDIEGIIISHFDKDHYGGIFSLINNIKVDRVMGGSDIPDLELKEALKEKNIPYIRLSKGNKLIIDKDTSLEILYPKDIRLSKNENDNSLVIILKAYDKRILFTGDIEKQVEKILVKEGIEPVDVLKVPHHGSNSSTSEEFISSLNPSISIISVGRNNLYKHPSKEVIDRLKSHDSTIYRTDFMGLIKLIVNDKKIIVKPYNKPFYRANIREIIIENNFNLIISILYLSLCFLSVRQYRRVKEDLRFEL